MSTIKLYGYSTSPYVRKVACYLGYKNVEFEFVPVNPAGNEQIAFTRQTQVPVLQVDDSWRKDSTLLGVWLDELFPDKPLLGTTDKEHETILTIDRWVTDRIIAGMFRSAYEAPLSATYNSMCWRLAAIVDSQTPLPSELRNMWPTVLKSAPFIKEIVERVAPSESVAEMNENLARELVDRLNGGPYLGGLDQPSLADLSLFPQLVFNYMVGIEDSVVAAKDTEVDDWLRRVQKTLPTNPILVPDSMIENQLS